MKTQLNEDGTFAKTENMLYQAWHEAQKGTTRRATFSKLKTEKGSIRIWGVVCCRTNARKRNTAPKTDPAWKTWWMMAGSFFKICIYLWREDTMANTCLCCWQYLSTRHIALDVQSAAWMRTQLRGFIQARSGEKEHYGTQSQAWKRVPSLKNFLCRLVVPRTLIKVRQVWSARQNFVPSTLTHFVRPRSKDAENFLFWHSQDLWGVLSCVLNLRVYLLLLLARRNASFQLSELLHLNRNNHVNHCSPHCRSCQAVAPIEPQERSGPHCLWTIAVCTSNQRPSLPVEPRESSGHSSQSSASQSLSFACVELRSCD